MAELIGTFEALVGFALATCAAFFFAAPGHFEKRLTRNKRFRRDTVAEFRHPAFGRLYLRKLRRALAWLRVVMGRTFGWRGALKGYGVCLTLAFVYSSLFLIFGWSFLGASGRIGPVELMPDWQWVWRALFALAVLAYATLTFFTVRWAKRRGTIAYTVAFAGSGVAAGALAGAVTVAFAAAFAGAGALAAAWSLAWLTGFGQDESLFLLFWTALPLANAGPDLISWWVSRWLGADLVRSVRAAGSTPRKLFSPVWHVAAAVFVPSCSSFCWPR